MAAEENVADVTTFAELVDLLQANRVQHTVDEAQRTIRCETDIAVMNWRILKGSVGLRIVWHKRIPLPQINTAMALLVMLNSEIEEGTLVLDISDGEIAYNYAIAVPSEPRPMAAILDHMRKTGQSVPVLFSFIQDVIFNGRAADVSEVAAVWKVSTQA